ncbi:hypothetical protein L1987_01689 [Smallanthus sonchifolius]|uniref:Uncharacterized protein n=1 Tax=Smallanthus sonchifolius TaxID=185202 RepID=A0ACB9K5P2_9ASTR|nr:hypothetical protein L1987_01689 [Smallanthus sonchifolius]
MGDDNLNDDQEAEAVETISLTDFPIAQDHSRSTLQEPASVEDFFEFFNEGLCDNSEDKMMSHAEDIIFCGKLVPINYQRKKPPKQTEKHHLTSQHNQPVGCRRSRSESMAKVKTTSANPLVRTSRSLDYKKLNRNSSMSSEPAVEISRDGSGKKSASSRWYVLLFGLVKVPPSEMDVRDMKNRRVCRSSSKMSSESVKVVPVTGSVDHRKCSWRLLGFLSCKSSSSATVTPPVGYMSKV